MNYELNYELWTASISSSNGPEWLYVYYTVCSKTFVAPTTAGLGIAVPFSF